MISKSKSFCDDKMPSKIIPIHFTSMVSENKSVFQPRKLLKVILGALPIMRPHPPIFYLIFYSYFFGGEGGMKIFRIFFWGGLSSKVRSQSSKNAKTPFQGMVIR